ncbi:hypothetical protein FRB90_001639 [Tulasnella sp. 427]|nr:hypothetical protein FRB90_001639 [Tulasnella sp. 427]
MPGGSSVVPPGTPTASAMSYSTMQQQPASSQQPAAGGAVPAEFQQLPHTFKIVTPKRPLLLCAPSEEEEIKWLSAVRALIARRTASVDSVGGPGTNQFALGQQPAPPQPPYQTPATQHGSPSKKSSRREPSASSSGSRPQGDYVITPAQASGIRKDATSLTGAAATAMKIQKRKRRKAPGESRKRINTSSRSQSTSRTVAKKEKKKRVSTGKKNNKKEKRHKTTLPRLGQTA